MNVLNLDDFSTEEINHILDLAEEFKSGKKVDYQGKKVVANLFFEPSTRTHYSFDMAALKLGCKTQNFDAVNSSLKKGESLYDTVKTFEMFGTDAVVIRHVENEYYDQLVGKINIPILNAGDGTGNHPSQSLLDLLTIRQEFGKFEGLKVVIVGDIRHSRVAHTNFKVMKRLGMEVYTSGPEEYREEGFNFVEFDEIIDKVDVVMLLRVQHERHSQKMNETVEEYHEAYGLNQKRVEKMKNTAIIMHPAPFNRNVEIADDVVECEKSRIFKQIQNGVFVRMALIHMVLGENV
ncbi:MAG: aspartate carbamoyltransferase catalytic subunit [Clostridia bacterium]|nr:aspartate carbamoyltransferase catalytic subunit [Clostridia bacterium]